VICQPVMSPVTPLKVWATGPNRMTSAGGAGGGPGRVAATAAGAAATADGADGIHSGLFCCLACGVRWCGASRSLAGHRRRTTAACPGCWCWVCGRGRVQRGRSRVIQGAWISTVRRVA
jgi:hypothetical protein